MMNNIIIKSDDPILITGAGGFIGPSLVDILMKYGFSNLRCLIRPTSNTSKLKTILDQYTGTNIQIVEGNLLSRDDCQKITQDVSIIYHLAAGKGEKSYPDAFLNSVVTTRNLLDSIIPNKNFRRFINVSSFTVYSTAKLKPGAILDETCEMEKQPESRCDAYCYAKVKQDELVMEYGKKYNIPYVILRPGYVYGPGNVGITGRVGINTFGFYIHLGGRNIIPTTYVDNCADAIALAGVKRNIDGEIFNIVDDNLPTSKKFLTLYKKNVRALKSVYLPHKLSYLLCYLWERYSSFSKEQLPPVFNRNRWAAEWKGNRYSNEKLKKLVSWQPKISSEDAMNKYYEFQREVGRLE